MIKVIFVFSALFSQSDLQRGTFHANTAARKNYD